MAATVAPYISDTVHQINEWWVLLAVAVGSWAGLQWERAALSAAAQPQPAPGRCKCQLTGCLCLGRTVMQA